MELDQKTGFPIAFLERMQAMLGEDYPAFLAHFALGTRYHGLRVNPLKLSPSEFLSRHRTLFSDQSLAPVPWTVEGFYYDEQDRPGKSPLHEAGIYYIQEPSAMSAAQAVTLPDKAHPLVLDLCAAPGGKSTQLAGKMMGEGLLVANEIVSSRAKILSQNIERLGISNALVLNETPDRLAERFPDTFDCILVDAPCSGEGMYRKNDIALTEWSSDNVKMCAERQARILDAAAQMLAPGGRLVYSTCTFAPDEDEAAICRFIATHPEFRLVDTGLEDYFTAGNPRFLPDEVKAVPGLEKTIRVWPHIVHGEGHFVAALEKSADCPGCPPDYPFFPLGSGRMEPAQKKLYREFCEQTLTPSATDWLEAGYFTLFGEELYRLPACTLPCDRLKVVRSGLHLGSFRKNRFEPAHALAVALRAEDFLQTVPVTMEQAEGYLRGETLDIPADKGWLGVVLQEAGGRYPLGWGKSDGKRVKNHYPKGLRRL